ncbi:glycosyltransferase family 4 protein [Pseudomonas sp. SK]|uniref:MraY family glycosyltransferase n=1 Tax=Pseudomonas sp. SK TaxID=2729423 RepID=UPI001464111A|nr:glycosyltransferase family 4 protein [Pseudomonas sp. SK]QJQ19690.1 glycosyltransferase family 4 protein [Pseudomonas sp. SK]
MVSFFLMLLVALLSFASTSLLRRYALKRNIIDVPNTRSSHQVPTPRGGGVAIVAAFLLVIPILAGQGSVSAPVAYALLGPGVGVALLGFLDDHGHIAARWRLVGHFSAALLILFCVNGFPNIEVFNSNVQLGWLGNVIGVLYLVWLLNLYNFMDGIDGLASLEAIFVSLGGALLYYLTDRIGEVWAPLMLAAASIGFLLWNFPPAKIFMGDAGSGFLGLALGVLSLSAGWIDFQLFFGWLILLGVFVVDATWTLFRRLLRGEKVYEAHRSHAYQFATRRYNSHLKVTLAILGMNLVWLLPLACAVALDMIEGVVAVLIAYTPLALLAFKFRAGEAENG